MSSLRPGAEIKYFNRYTQQIETEKIYGDAFLRFVYESPMGSTLGKIFTNAPFSKAYGFFQSRGESGKKVPGFVKMFGIQMEEFLPGSLAADHINDSYASFNEFFIRKFKDGKRLIVIDDDRMPAFAEARYVGFAGVDDRLKFPVKGNFLRAKDLLQNEPLAKSFEGGPLMIARLCPVDYHRFHYPDDGEVLDHYAVHGDYHSVNPLALKARGDIFIRNERYVSLLQTKNFGKIAYIEVGAICVGKIVQTHNLKKFKRGQEKGYFLFGGSTVIIMGEKGAWTPSPDILERTNLGMETYIHLGDEVALKK